MKPAIVGQPERTVVQALQEQLNSEHIILIVDEPPPIPIEQVLMLEYIAPLRCPDFSFKKMRNYPTLREGLRNPKIRKRG